MERWSGRVVERQSTGVPKWWSSGVVEQSGAESSGVEQSVESGVCNRVEWSGVAWRGVECGVWSTVEWGVECAPTWAGLGLGLRQEYDKKLPKTT